MYVIKIDGAGVHGNGVSVLEPMLETRIDTSGTLTFRMVPDSQGYDTITPLKSEAEVLVDTTCLWLGRVLDVVKDFDNIKTITCEGLIAYFNDSQVEPCDEDLELVDWIEYLIAQHNAQVEPVKHFALGDVTVTPPGDDDTERVEAEYRATRQCIEDLRTKYKGYFRVRRENGINYLDYVDEFTESSTQQISFGQNLLDLTTSMKGEFIKTVLIPIGEEGLTIEDVNQGKKYLENTSAIALYGRVVGTVYHENISDEQELLETGLEDIEKIPIGITARAVDLSIIDKDINAFNVGEWTRILSPPHGVDVQLQIPSIR